LNVSFNRLNQIDSGFLSADPQCLHDLRTLDISNNLLEYIPTLFLSKIPSLREIFLQNNFVLSLDLSLLVLVYGSVNLSNNRISRVMNSADVNIAAYDTIRCSSIDLRNNNQIIELSDSIYEMYGACHEVESLANTSTSLMPILTLGLSSINFAQSSIECSCDHYHLYRTVKRVFGIDQTGQKSRPNIMCTNGMSIYNSSNVDACVKSTVNSTNVKPRLCKIWPDSGELTLSNITESYNTVST
jgi:hypothetical protein